MGRETSDSDWGPDKSGDQGVPGGGSSRMNSDGSEHHTDFSKGEPHEHHSWDEKGGEVTGQHTTTDKADDSETSESSESDDSGSTSDNEDTGDSSESGADTSYSGDSSDGDSGSEGDGDGDGGDSDGGD